MSVMTAERVRVRLRAQAADEYHVLVGAGLLTQSGTQARRSLDPGVQRLALISNEKVFELYGAALLKSLRAAAFRVEPFLIGDGERHKNLRTLEQALAFLASLGLERTDAVVALGGGVVGDLAGLAAALYLRGIAFLQIPTTLLAQVDGAVLVDTETLRTLPARELTAGWCEAVKHGAAGDRRLFDRTVEFLKQEPATPSPSSDTALARLIAAHISFKASIVSGDEREDVGRTDYRSRRILNFGHTTAHALEAVTGYRRFRHGEAVGYGMLVAGEISKRLGTLDGSELELLRDAVRSCGWLPRADDLAPTRIISALASDKKSVGGSVKWILLERLGRALIVDGREISARVLRDSLRAALHKTS
jgi:3-dehydroquinate synthase